MRLLVKTVGLVMIISASTLLGFLKARELINREKTLFKIYLCLTDLRERIRLDGGELNRLLRQSFAGTDFTEGGIPKIKGLSADDIKLLEEYIQSAGMADTLAECDRAQLYAEIFLKRREAAKNQADRLCRLYRTLGFMCGIFICIFLM